MKIEQITRFIEKDLRKKIQREVRPSKIKLPKITNERDLESSIYFHLRDKIRKVSNFKIATNFSVRGYRKKGASEKNQMMPDIVILEWIDDLQKPKIKLMIELKIMKPSEPLDISKDGFENIIKNQDGFVSDFRKLNYAKRKKWVDYGYFVYLYHSPKISQRTVENLIRKEVEKGVSKMRFKPIAINKFESRTSNKKIATRGMIKSRHKARQLYSSYVGTNDNHLWDTCSKCDKLELTHTTRDYNRCNPSTKGRKRLSSTKRSIAAKKAARTKKRKATAVKAKRSASAKKAARTRRNRKGKIRELYYQ